MFRWLFQLQLLLFMERTKSKRLVSISDCWVRNLKHLVHEIKFFFFLNHDFSWAVQCGCWFLIFMYVNINVHSMYGLSNLQTETIDLNEQGIKADRSQRTFGRSNLDKSSHQFIDIDGLPYVGQVNFLLCVCYIFQVRMMSTKFLTFSRG